MKLVDSVHGTCRVVCFCTFKALSVDCDIAVTVVKLLQCKQQCNPSNLSSEKFLRILAPFLSFFFLCLRQT